MREIIKDWQVNFNRGANCNTSS